MTQHRDETSLPDSDPDHFGACRHDDELVKTQVRDTSPYHPPSWRAAGYSVFGRFHAYLLGRAIIATLWRFHPRAEGSVRPAARTQDAEPRG